MILDNEPKKISGLEGLRAILALWVVLGHISQTVSLEIPVIEQNTIAVDVFIILSGFVIFRAIDLKHQSIAAYFVQRLCRLYPLYGVVLLYSIIMIPVQISALQTIPFHSVRNLQRLELVQSFLATPWKHIAAHMFLIQGVVPPKLLPSAAYTIVGQAWSISLEYQFYIVAPFVYLIWQKPAFRPIVFIVAGVLLLKAGGMSHAFLGDKIFLFAIGIGSYLYTKNTAQNRKAGCAALLIIVGLIVQREGPYGLWPLVIWLTTLWSLIEPRNGALRAVGQLLGSTPLVHYGARSYALYLVHMIPLYAVAYGLNGAGLSPIGYRIYLAVLVIILSYALADAAYQRIELRGISKGKRLVASLKAPRPI